MTIATGVGKQVAYKAEVTWGTAPAASGAQSLRRITSTLSLRKQTYESQEVATHMQRVDMRHGVRSIGGAINGELSAGTWKDFFAAALRRTFATVAAITGASITVAGSGPTYTITRAAGSWITDGIKVGQVGRLTAGTFNAANLNKNLFILAETATILTVMPLNGVALVAEGPIGSATWTPTGKTTYAPATGQIDTSFSIEHFHSDTVLSEVFLGCKVDKIAVALPPTGLGTISMDFIGRDVTTAGAQYFTSPTAPTATGVFASVNGIMQTQGGQLALLTGLSFDVTDGMSSEPVVGQNIYADIAEGLMLVSGQCTALFQDATMRDYFINETEVSLSVALAASNAAAAGIMGFTLPRIKFGGADKDDGQKHLVQTLPFTALYNVNGGAGTTSEQTTLAIQDSQA